MKNFSLCFFLPLLLSFPYAYSQNQGSFVRCVHGGGHVTLNDCRCKGTPQYQRCEQLVAADGSDKSCAVTCDQCQCPDGYKDGPTVATPRPLASQSREQIRNSSGNIVAEYVPGSREFCVDEFRQQCPTSMSWQGCPQDNGRSDVDMVRDICIREGFHNFSKTTVTANRADAKCGYTTYAFSCFP